MTENAITLTIGDPDDERGRITVQHVPNGGPTIIWHDSDNGEQSVVIPKEFVETVATALQLRPME